MGRHLFHKMGPDGSVLVVRDRVAVYRFPTPPHQCDIDFLLSALRRLSH